MRKYTDTFVKTKLYSRISTAACPFPGKYPLRFLFGAGGKILYHGKFHANIWRRFWKLRPRQFTTFLIYDKAGAIVFGTNMETPQIARTELMYRYFGTTWVNGQLLLDCKLKLLGPYRVYVGLEDRTRDWESRFTHYVNTSIPHVRTI